MEEIIYSTSWRDLAGCSLEKKVEGPRGQKIHAQGCGHPGALRCPSHWIPVGAVGRGEEHLEGPAGSPQPPPPLLRLSPPEPALGISQMTFRAQGPPLTFPCLFLPNQMQYVGPASCLVPPASSPCQVQPGYRATGEPTCLPAGSGLAAPAP